MISLKHSEYSGKHQALLLSPIALSSCIPVPETCSSLQSAFTFNMCICVDPDDSYNLDSNHHDGSRWFEWITGYNRDRVLFYPDSDNDYMYWTTTFRKTTTLIQKCHRFWWFNDHRRYSKCYSSPETLLSSSPNGPRANTSLLQSIAVGLCISGLVYGELSWPVKPLDLEANHDFFFVGPPYGFGRHEAALSPEDIESFLQVRYHRVHHTVSETEFWTRATMSLVIFTTGLLQVLN